MEQELILKYKNNVRIIEIKYVDYAKRLLVQKQAILNNLEKQFNERRECIKQILADRAKNKTTVEQKNSVQELSSLKPADSDGQSIMTEVELMQEEQVTHVS